MTPVRLALIGFGRWGRNYVRAARESGEAEVVEVVVRQGSPALLGASAYGQGFSIGASLEDALSQVDAVIYAGHPSGAADVAEEALTSGKPILVEKPAGLELRDAERISRAEGICRLGGLRGFVLVGHQHLFSEGFEALRIVAEDDATVMACTFTGPVARDYPGLWDYGPHGAACALALGASVDGAQHAFVAGLDTFRLLRQGSYVRVIVGVASNRLARVGFDLPYRVSYDAYVSSAELPLTRQVRAFARAVRAGGTDDYRFGARWAVDVARVLDVAPPRQ